MKPTTVQQRMDMLHEINNVARDMVTTWCRRWNRDGQAFNLSWQDDGTAIVEVDGDAVGRVLVEITTSVVDYVDAVNKPRGFTITRTWGTVPSGWFVQAPNGWYEVVTSTRDGDRQMVTLDVGGQQGTWPRDPDAEVKVRRGTLADETMDAAVDALGPGTEILKDTPPFDPPYVRT